MEAGSGTGLGLSLNHDIVVKGHVRTSTVESEEGEGFEAPGFSHSNTSVSVHRKPGSNIDVNSPPNSLLNSAALRYAPSSSRYTLIVSSTGSTIQYSVTPYASYSFRLTTSSCLRLPSLRISTTRSGAPCAFFSVRTDARSVVCRSSWVVLPGVCNYYSDYYSGSITQIRRMVSR